MFDAPPKYCQQAKVEDVPAIPIPARSSRRPLLVPVGSASAERASQQQSSHSRRKSSVRSFFSSSRAQDRDASMKKPWSGGDRVTLSHDAASSDQEDCAMESRPQHGQSTRGRMTLSKRRKGHQPVFSMVSPTSSTQKPTPSPSSHKTRSALMRPAPPRDWFPPSSSGSEEDLSLAAGRDPNTDAVAVDRNCVQAARGQSDEPDGSQAASISSSLREGPAATYLLDDSQERDYTEVVRSQQQQNIATRPLCRNRTVWISDTEMELSDPSSTETPQEQVLAWAPEKAKEVCVQEQELEIPSPEDDEWPLPPMLLRTSTDASTPEPSPLTPKSKHSLHASLASRATISSTAETVVSPTFSVQAGMFDEPSPPSSTEIGRAEDGVDPCLLFAKRHAVVTDAGSIAESEISERWMQTPKERLGLGGSLRRCDTLPWEEVQSKASSRRASRVNVSTLSRRKSNGFSALLGWS